MYCEIEPLISCPTDGSVSAGDKTPDGYLIVDREMLENMIENDEDVTTVCTSLITDMSSLFYNKSEFNQDLSRWDVSNLTSMYAMFRGAIEFNQDLSGWVVLNVTNMNSMFKDASSFTNQDLSTWDVNKVETHQDFITNSGTGNIEPSWSN